MDLAGLVLDDGVKSVAIVGTAKNVGKTVTMNHLLSKLAGRGLVVGLVSSGRDGETTDCFTGEPKPSVVPPEGAWIATAEGCWANRGFFEIADVFERVGLLEVGCGRMRESEPGTRGRRARKELASWLKAAATGLTGEVKEKWIESPPQAWMAGAVVLSTGASAGTDLALVARATASIVKLWSLKMPDDPEVLSLARQAVDQGRVAFLEEVPAEGSARRGGSRPAPEVTGNLANRRKGRQIRSAAKRRYAMRQTALERC